jgi:hypothetical protein
MHPSDRIASSTLALGALAAVALTSPDPDARGRAAHTYRGLRRNLWRLTRLPWSSFRAERQAYKTLADIPSEMLRPRVAAALGIDLKPGPPNEPTLAEMDREQMRVKDGIRIRTEVPVGRIAAKANMLAAALLTQHPKPPPQAPEIFPGEVMEPTPPPRPQLVSAEPKTIDPVVDNAAPEPPLPASFWIDTRVEWTSSHARKLGRITHVLPPGLLPRDIGIKMKDGDKLAPRDHESYVVRGYPVDAEGKKAGSETTYWPRVSLLKLV